MPHDAQSISLLGQRVTVYSNGITWKCPDDSIRYLIGKTRIEAIAYLESWMADRAGHLMRPFRKQGPGAPTKIPARQHPGRPPKHATTPRMYMRALYYAAARAKRSGMKIMSQDEFKAIVERTEGCCEVSGIPFSDVVPDGANKAMWAPSLDRLDCHAGYEASNCRLVCVAVNLAMNEFGHEVLMKIARAMVDPSSIKKKKPRAPKEDPQKSSQTP